jgi:NAD(P)-dependent dehydrogenase (short-subunit alcohol dehydrogenase family)
VPVEGYNYQELEERMEKRAKFVVVTGASSGIGYQAALDFARTGAVVIGVGRDPQRCEAAKQRILADTPNANVTFLVADLAHQDQLRELGVKIGHLVDERTDGKLDVLVNNAGLYMQKRVITEDGVETTFAVNHLAPMLLSYLLLSYLKKTENSRIITVSSNSHYNTWFNPAVETRPSFYFGFWAYKVSKLGNVLFSRQFNRMLQGKNPQAFAVDPGLVNTEIGLKGTGGLVQAVWRGRQAKGMPAEVPSRTILHVANADGLDAQRDVYWRDSKPKQPSKAALNDNLGERLWQESCRLCGIPTDWNSS